MKKLLFVCLGNICRSPTAEAVMKKLVVEKGLENEVMCDSCGTIAYHQGEEADPRMRKHAQKRGVYITSLARGFKQPSDFEEFDYILTMDSENYRNILALDPERLYASKVLPITDFCRQTGIKEVPDPYYGGDQGFEDVLTILEDACAGFLSQILKA